MSLRKDIADAIMRGIDSDNRPKEYENEATMRDVLDPDTCYMAADEVIATLMSKLSGQHFRAEKPNGVIGAASIVSDGIIYD